MMKNEKNIFAIGSILMAVSIMLGAFAAHSLKDIWSEYSLDVFDKAVRYMLYHSLGILILGTLITRYQKLSNAVLFFLVGILLFSGSLILLAATHIKILGAITPLGGLAFIFGWLYTTYIFLKK